MPQFYLYSLSGRVVKRLSADKIESVFQEDNKMLVVTIDGKEYSCDHMSYIPPEEVEQVN